MATHNERVVKYNKLNGKYLKDVDELLRQKDYSQASEKYWGAAAEAAKAYAEPIGRHLKTHADLWDFVIGLNKKEPRLNLLHLFADANHLHSNFYEDELRPEVVEELAKSTKKYIKTVRGLAE